MLKYSLISKLVEVGIYKIPDTFDYQILIG